MQNGNGATALTKETDMKLEPLMQRIEELAAQGPCRMAYLQNVTGASELSIRRAITTLQRRGRLKKQTVTFYTAERAESQ